MTQQLASDVAVGSFFISHIRDCVARKTVGMGDGKG